MPAVPRTSSDVKELVAIRQALAVDERLVENIRHVAKAMADNELRESYKTLDAAILIRQAGIAEGIEKLARELTKAPSSAPKDRTAPR